MAERGFFEKKGSQEIQQQHKHPITVTKGHYQALYKNHNNHPDKAHAFDSTKYFWIC